MKLPGRDMPWRDFLARFKDEYKRDRLQDAAGALVFFGILAIAPFLLFLVTLAGLIIDPQQIQNLVDEMAAIAPPQVTELLKTQLTEVSRGASAGLLTVGAAAAIWAASKGVLAVMRAFNEVYDVQEGRPFWKVRGIAIGMVLFIGVLGMLGALIAVAAPAVGNALGEPWSTIFTWFRLPVAAVVVMFVWAVAYWVLPDVEQKFKFVTPGSIFGVLVWVAASWGFSVYVKNFGNYNATYGSLGAIIVLLMWLWISSLVLVIGAEVNAIVEHVSPDGKAKGAKRQADTGGEDDVRPEAWRRKSDRGRLPVGEEGPRPQPERALPFSPSQVTVQRRVDREQALINPRPKSRSPATAALAAAWGAFIGLSLVRMRRRQA